MRLTSPSRVSMVLIITVFLVWTSEPLCSGLVSITGSTYTLSLIKARPGLLPRLGVRPWSHGVEPRRHPHPLDEPVSYFFSKTSSPVLEVAQQTPACATAKVRSGANRGAPGVCVGGPGGQGIPKAQAAQHSPHPPPRHLLTPSSPWAAGEPCMDLHTDSQDPKARSKTLFRKTSWDPAPLRLQMSTLMS